MSIPKKPSSPSMWVDIIILLLLIGLTFSGVVSLFLNSTTGLNYIEFAFAVLGTGISYLQVKSNLLRSLLGKMKITLSQRNVQFIRGITVVLLILVIALQSILIVRTFMPSPIASGSQFLAVGEAGAILTSSDKQNWTTQASGTSKNLQGVVWANSQYLVVGEAGTILTSPDGKNWTTQASGTSKNLKGVVWADYQFLAVGEAGTVLTSPDGKNWTTQTSGTSKNLQGVVWARFSVSSCRGSWHDSYLA